MSTEPDLNAEFNLPEELRSVETALRQFSPEQSQLDRDELMYRAGWESARAEQQASPTSLRIWQAAAGVLAASLALVLAQPVDYQRGEAVATTANEPSDQAEPDVPTNKPIRPPASDLPATYIRSTAPLLVMRGRALNQNFSELPLTSVPDVVDSPRGTTNLMLIEELLPRRGDAVAPLPSNSRLGGTS